MLRSSALTTSLGTTACVVVVFRLLYADNGMQGRGQRGQEENKGISSPPCVRRSWTMTSMVVSGVRR